MKRVLLFIIIITGAFQLACAQYITPSVTVYKQFKPAIIQLTDGRKLNQPLANVFLKNSSLLYMKGDKAMEANMKNILSVEFDDRTYIKIDTLLAYLVDTVGTNALYCANKIDFVAYRQGMINNQVYTNISLSDQLSSTTIDLSNEGDLQFPIIPVFFYRLDGKMVLVHERNLSRVLNKEKRRLMKSVMAEDGFSWTDEKWLIKILKVLNLAEEK